MEEPDSLFDYLTYPGVGAVSTTDGKMILAAPINEHGMT